MYYGAAFRGIQQSFRGDNQILIRIEAQTDLAGYALHPTLLDAAFQSLIGMVDADDNNSFVPVALKRLCFYQSPPQSFWAYSRLTQRSAQSIVADVWLFDDKGQVLVNIEELRCQALANTAQQRDINDWFYQVVWQTQVLTHKREPLKGGWLLFMDKQGVAEAMAQRLQKAEVVSVTKVYAGKQFKQLEENNFSVRRQNQEDMSQVMQAMPDNLQGILFAWTLDLDSEQDVDGRLMAMDLLYCARASVNNINSAQQYTQHLYILTQQAQNVAGAEINVAQASIIGLGRVITNEYTLRCSLLDIETAGNPQLLSLLAEELLADDNEIEVAFYQQQRLVYRLQHWQNKTQQQTHSITGKDVFELQQQKQVFYWQQIAEKTVAADEIELHIDYIVLPQGFNLAQENLSPVYATISRSQHKQYPQGQAVIALLSLDTLSSYITVTPDNSFILSAPKTSLFKRLGKQTAQLPEAVSYAGSLQALTNESYTLETLLSLNQQSRVLICDSDDNRDMAAVQIALKYTSNVIVSYRLPQKKASIETNGY